MKKKSKAKTSNDGFCPYCRKPLRKTHNINIGFCPPCGRQIRIE